MNKSHFDEGHLLHELQHYLPSQTPLKDFIHHNSLHAFQRQKFFDAIFSASDIFGYQVTFNLNEYRKLYANGRITNDMLRHTLQKRKGDDAKAWEFKLLYGKYEYNYNPRIGRLRSEWKSIYKADLDNSIHPMLFRILSGYLDQGVALWHFPFEDKGLLQAIRLMEKNSFTSFFKTKRVKKLLIDETTSIESLLEIVVSNRAFYEQYIFDQQFAHRGWSGMVAAIEAKPESLLYPKKINLKELIILELLMEIDHLDVLLGKKWKPLGLTTTLQPLNLFQQTAATEAQEVLQLWQDAFEWSYYDEVLRGVQQLQQKKTNGLLIHMNVDKQKTFQAIFCIDERECSLRRHVETTEPQCETLGCPGFFGVEFFFQPAGGKFYEKLCPAPITPKYLIKETAKVSHRPKEFFYTKKSHTFMHGFLITLSLGLLAPFRLMANLFRPKMNAAISNAFAHMNIDGQLQIENTSLSNVENELQVGFTIAEMATRVENLLRGIGMIENFAPLIYVVAHGSSSANNPHHGAHDCGACSGRPGATNARVFAFMANHTGVRKILGSNGLLIPAETIFVGAMHDTASDEMAFYDDKQLPASLTKLHNRNKEKFEAALDMNAKERARRFASINVSKPIRHVREAIRRRSVSFFEPRPELGHGTNALCFVGNRSLTKGLFLDRRAFMNSYNYRSDPDGKFLLNVISPLPPVCGGINLEYYFSRVDNYKLGAGTKLPHNVVGLIGVANSSDGDLRPGLPLQMIEVHDPVRLMILVEHYPAIILKTIQTSPTLYEWFINEWVHLTAIEPETGRLYYFRNGVFEQFIPTDGSMPLVDDIHELIESALEMKTNHILDATKENLPVQLID